MAAGRASYGIVLAAVSLVVVLLLSSFPLRCSSFLFLEHETVAHGERIRVDPESPAGGWAADRREPGFFPVCSITRPAPYNGCARPQSGFTVLASALSV